MIRSLSKKDLLQRKGERQCLHCKNWTVRTTGIQVATQRHYLASYFSTKIIRLVTLIKYSSENVFFLYFPPKNNSIEGLPSKASEHGIQGFFEEN